MNKSTTITPDGEIYILYRDDDGLLRSISRSFNDPRAQMGEHNIPIWSRSRYRGRLSKRARRVLIQLGYKNPESLLKPVDSNQTL